MTTRCRWLPLENSLPAAIPTFSATSEVIGGLLASPRMPSVPKYRRDMSAPRLPRSAISPRSSHRVTYRALAADLHYAVGFPRTGITSHEQRLHQLATVR